MNRGEKWCVICNKPSLTGHVVGAGNGSGDGVTGRFAHAECYEKRKKTAPLATVHILHEGRSLCGLPGVPKDWPDGHTWVGRAERGKATCDACLGGTKRRYSGPTEGLHFRLQGEAVGLGTRPLNGLFSPLRVDAVLSRDALLVSMDEVPQIDPMLVLFRGDPNTAQEENVRRMREGIALLIRRALEASANELAWAMAKEMVPDDYR